MKFVLRPLSLLFKVRPAGQRWRLHHAELRARSLPHAAPHRVAALERLPRDGHGGDETGGERHPQLLPDRPGPAQPPHPGHAPLHPVQDVARGQSHYPRNAGEDDEDARAFRVIVRKSSVMFFNNFNGRFGDIRRIIVDKISNRGGREKARFFLFF